MPLLPPWCNNQCILKSIKKHTPIIKLGHHKEAEADLLLTHTKWTTNPPLKHKVTWVKGHQDDKKDADDLTEHERLNISMDTEATSAYASSNLLMMKWQDQVVFPDEKWAIFIDDTKIMMKLKDSILYQYHREETETYVKNEHGLWEYDMSHINWEGMRSYMTKPKISQRAVAANNIHGWLPTQSSLHKQRWKSDPRCPFAGVQMTQKQLPMY